MQIITTVVAHIDHGKTTLIDSLLAYTKTISLESAGELRYLDTRADELHRGITLKLSAISINNKYCFVDTPGHIDLHHCVANSNYLADVSLLIVDINEGITPRTYSLLSNKPTVLFINKIDKILNLNLEDIVFRVEEVICNVQALFDQKYKVEPFNWQRNNVILGCTKYCYAINFNNFSEFKQNSSIKSVIYFLQQIVKNIENKNEIPLFRKYKITDLSMKGVLNTLFSLTQCVFYSIEEFYKKDYIFEFLNPLIEEFEEFKEVKEVKEVKEFEKVKEFEEVKEFEKVREFEAGIINYKSEALNLKVSEEIRKNKEIQLLKKSELATTFGIEKSKNLNEISAKIEHLSVKNQEIKAENLQTNEDYSSLSHKSTINDFKKSTIFFSENWLKSNNFKFFGLTTYSIKWNEKVLFITRTIFGKLSKNDILFSINNKFREVKVNSIYKFINDRLIECPCTENTGLFALEGNFLPQSTLIIGPKFYINLEASKMPFYAKLLVLNNLNELELFKSIFKSLKKTESAIKIILNKFNEFELLTQGKVHLEKVLFDFDELYNSNSIIYNEIKELNYGKGYLLLDNPGDFVECIDQPIKKFIDNSNFIEFIPLDTPEILIECNCEFIESILIDFINCASLIQEKLLFTKIKYFSSEKDYNKAKSFLKTIYLLTQPFIASLHILINLEIPANYLSIAYNTINLYLGVCESTELFNFYYLKIQLPSIFYNEFVEKMSVSAQGTVFIQPQGYVYLKREGVFDRFVGKLRREKGMDIEILED